MEEICGNNQLFSSVRHRIIIFPVRHDMMLQQKNFSKADKSSENFTQSLSVRAISWSVVDDSFLIVVFSEAEDQIVDCRWSIWIL